MIEGLSKYVYGTTRLGDEKIPVDDRISMAREAMRSGVWFHASRQYGDALEVLGRAFDRDRTAVPRMIFKIGNEGLDELERSIDENLKPLGLECMDVGQLCLGGDYADQLARGGACYDDFRRLKEHGRVRQFVLEVFPWTSRPALAALEGGYTEGIVDAFIFYLNPLQRFADNALWDSIRARHAKVIAMRTVSGAPVHTLRDVPGAAWRPYLQERAAQVAPIFERSGVSDWVEFCVRFAFSFPEVLATVGSTSRKPNLELLLRETRKPAIEPLAPDVIDELSALQRRWSDEVDVRAEPWTM